MVNICPSQPTSLLFVNVVYESPQMNKPPAKRLCLMNTNTEILLGVNAMAVVRPC